MAAVLHGTAGTAAKKGGHMKAWVLQDIGTITYRDVPDPVPGEAEVLVRVQAAGICGSDIPRIYRDGAHKMPLVPGHEFAGEVVAVGKWADPKWLHKRVGVYPLIPCHSCAACRKGQHEMCRQYSYLGSRRDGGFAEYVAVPQNNLVELPPSVTYEQAAMLEPLSVAVHAMRRVEILQEDTVAVCGLGTIGMLLVMLLTERGIRDLLLIGNKEYQKKKALEIGIPEENFCDSRQNDVPEWVRRHTTGKGADVFLECVGRNQTVSWAADLAAAGGKVCLVGNPDTDMTLDKQTYWKILRNQLLLAGTWNSSFFASENAKERESTDWEYALRLLAQGRIKPQRLISHRFRPEQLEEGLLIMRDKREDYQKIMVCAEP